MESTKPFEMSDFYKYSTKYKRKNGSESSGSSSENNNKPPELPAKNSPAKTPAPPPPPPPPKKNLNNDLGETFSSEMLQWYKNNQTQTRTQKSEKEEKPATLV